MRKFHVGVLGATGIVGQKYVSMLSTHPWFEVSYLAASKNSAGKNYCKAIAGRGNGITNLSREIASMQVHDVESIKACADLCDFVFCALDTQSAAIYEEKYAQAGLPVVSNASSHRMDSDVPVIMPEVNHGHISIIPQQQRRRGWESGFIVTKPNCSLQSYLLPLYPLHRELSLQKILVTTLQAASGAGYPGVSSLDLIDNAVPFIAGEEEKSEQEPRKILGSISGSGIVPLIGLEISAQCNRVPVLDGHLACISASFREKAGIDSVIDLWNNFTSLPQELSLPSAPEKPVIYMNENDRPQPRLDRFCGNGMSVTVGRARECNVLDLRFVALSHNTIRGAAGGGILNAELLAAKGFIS